MPQTSLPSAAYADSKPHYDILDGLRGVAALLVVVFHLCEAHATSHFDQLLNHGYLAVDFFFALSGFVIGYAYDDRWGRMTVGGFFKRRLIRLQPMVVLGMAVGAALFYFQDCDMWPVHAVPVWKMLAVMLVGMTLLPVPVSMDVRGWQEMHPLNGPGWSLFFRKARRLSSSFSPWEGAGRGRSGTDRKRVGMVHEKGRFPFGRKFLF